MGKRELYFVEGWIAVSACSYEDAAIEASNAFGMDVTNVVKEGDE